MIGYAWNEKKTYGRMRKELVTEPFSKSNEENSPAIHSFQHDRLATQCVQVAIRTENPDTYAIEILKKVSVKLL